MSSTSDRAERARHFYDTTTGTISRVATTPGTPLSDLRAQLGPRFPVLVTQSLHEHGPYLLADVEAGCATLDEVVHVGLVRVEGALRRRLEGALAAGAVS